MKQPEFIFGNRCPLAATGFVLSSLIMVGTPTDAVAQQVWKINRHDPYAFPGAVHLKNNTPIAFKDNTGRELEIKCRLSGMLPSIEPFPLVPLQGWPAGLSFYTRSGTSHCTGQGLERVEEVTLIDRIGTRNNPNARQDFVVTPETLITSRFSPKSYVYMERRRDYNARLLRRGFGDKISMAMPIAQTNWIHCVRPDRSAESDLVSRPFKGTYTYMFDMMPGVVPQRVILPMPKAASLRLVCNVDHAKTNNNRRGYSGNWPVFKYD